MTVTSREALADLWHKAAQLTRKCLFGSEDPLRPEYTQTLDLTSQIDVPAIGMVGRRYNSASITFVSVNPAGGKPQSRSIAVDNQLYDAFRRMRDPTGVATRLEAFDYLTDRFDASVRTWKIWRQHIEPILTAVSRKFEQTAYLYLVPFRTRGDAGSRMSDTFTKAGYELHLKPQLDALAPHMIIAVDRPSERMCHEWACNTTTNTAVIYYTRKRDAHSERKELLSQLEKRLGA